MEKLKSQLETYTELHWWSMGKKTLSFKGQLGDLLKEQNISFTIQKTKVKKGIFKFNFKSLYGIRFSATGTNEDFPHLAKQAIQMELVRMGDKSQLYVSNCWRPKVTVNF